MYTALYPRPDVSELHSTSTQHDARVQVAPDIDGAGLDGAVYHLEQCGMVRFAGGWRRTAYIGWRGEWRSPPEGKATDLPPPLEW